jgi:hypothetical protein
MPLAVQYQRVEDEYYRLKGKYAAGRLTEEQFDQALKDLIIRDTEGRFWMVGADTGDWYVSDGGAWVKAQPPSAAPATTPPLPPVTPAETRDPRRAGTAPAAKCLSE